MSDWAAFRAAKFLSIGQAALRGAVVPKIYIYFFYAVVCVLAIYWTVQMLP